MGNIPAFTSSGRLTLGRACGAGRLRLGRAGRLGSPAGKGIRPEEKVRTKSKPFPLGKTFNPCVFKKYYPLRSEKSRSPPTMGSSVSQH